jgi:hypothetical protein
LPAFKLAQKIEALIKMERHAVYAYAPPFLNAKGKPMVDTVRKAVCKRLGVADRTIYTWKTDQNAHMDFDTADNILQRAYWNWFDVWDGDEPVAGGRTVRDVFESTRLTTGIAA